MYGIPHQSHAARPGSDHQGQRVPPRVRDVEGAQRPAERDGAKRNPEQPDPAQRGNAQSPYYLRSVISEKFANWEKWLSVLNRGKQA